MAKPYVRSFNLTPELCDIIDKLPNKSALARELFQSHFQSNPTQLTVSAVKKLIEERIKALNLTYAPMERDTISHTQEIDIEDELNALLSISNGTVLPK